MHDNSFYVFVVKSETISSLPLAEKEINAKPFAICYFFLPCKRKPSNEFFFFFWISQPFKMKLFPAAYWAILMLLSQMATASPFGLQGDENAVAPRDATAKLDERNVFVPPELDERDVAAPPLGLSERQVDERDVTSFAEPGGESLQRRQMCWPERPTSIKRYFTHPWRGLAGNEILMRVTSLNNGRFSWDGSCQQWNTRKAACDAVCVAYYGSCPNLSACWSCRQAC